MFILQILFVIRLILIYNWK